MANQVIMTNNEERPLREYGVPNVKNVNFRVVRPAVEGKSFEICTPMISMVSSNAFYGLPSEDPNSHIRTFLELCDTFRIDGMTDDALRLRLFPFSLKDKAKRWYQSILQATLTTCEALAEKFLMKYFPPAKTTILREELNNF